ncbi:hypothetical protein MMC28_003424 [Mycoblastus sanguinarius]|nr:hypothetical protein [Mycoblastus sanguinarius]
MVHTIEAVAQMPQTMFEKLRIDNWTKKELFCYFNWKKCGPTDNVTVLKHVMQAIKLHDIDFGTDLIWVNAQKKNWGASAEKGVTENGQWHDGGGKGSLGESDVESLAEEELSAAEKEDEQIQRLEAQLSQFNVVPVDAEQREVV